MRLVTRGMVLCPILLVWKNAGSEPISRPRFQPAHQVLSGQALSYDSEKDHYVCPQGQILPLVSRRGTEQVLVYKAKAEACNACPVKGECTGSKSGRHIFRSLFQEYLDKAETYRQTKAYLKALRKRSVWVEPLFGEAKEFHRLRRLLKVNIEGVMVAAGQNLKRLIKHELGMLFSFLKLTSSCLIFSTILDFFNSLGHYAISEGKTDTYSVEGDNAELRHYLARLARSS